MTPDPLTSGRRSLVEAAETGASVDTGASSNAGASPLWRSLEEFADTEEFRQLVADEFPGLELPVADGVTRRSFLAAMGASIALAGFAGCRGAPHEEIVPRVEELAAEATGRPQYFASAMVLEGLATGLLVEQQQGRPIKIEGNPDHPASLGATDCFAQASLLTFYDPDRSQHVRFRGRPSTWSEASQALAQVIEPLRARGGAGLYILTEAISSPTLVDQLEQLRTELPEMRWAVHEPLVTDATDIAAEAAFGRVLDAVPDMSRAELIVSLDADFLGPGPRQLRHAHDFAVARRVWKSAPAAASMSRLCVLSPTPTLTWAAADQRLTLPARSIETFARSLAVRLQLPVPDTSENAWDGETAALLDALARDLRDRSGRCLILAGPQQSVAVQVLVHAMNVALGNVGETIKFIPAVVTRAHTSSITLPELARDIEAGRVEALVILGANPVYSAPADAPLGELLRRIPFSLHLGVYCDETGEQCQWHVHEAHYLESWGDARAYDGTASLIQPIVAPLYGGHSALEIVACVRGQSEPSPHEMLRRYWRSQWQTDEPAFAQRWHQSLHDGVIADTQYAPVEVALRDDWADAVLRARSTRAGANGTRELVLRADPTVYDGRFANNAWLQELPKPLSKVTWENIAICSPRTAAALGLEQQVGERGGDMQVDIVRLDYQGRTIEAPAWIMPGQADDCVTLYLGYGRTAGQVARGRGYNAYQLRSAERPWFDDGVTITKTGRRQSLATTQLHHVLRGRDLVRAGTLEQYRREPATFVRPAHRQSSKPENVTLPILEASAAGESRPSAPSLYPAFSYDRYRWGMVIDLNACMGCSACVVACQAENNIPVVGREEVLRGREMHWLRVDSYHAGKKAEAPEATYFQPVPCMHCEQAPCEVVCPVNATVHSDEGLNDMSYARCIGTRYCSNNCPYKVRRFNYLAYADWETESLKALRNPDVTVRSRGVMEKCTYCVQRINRARIHAERDERPLVKNAAGTWIKPIYEGELLTACQAACPTQAIVFGDLNDPQSTVAQLRYEQPLNYALLDELGTQPRTTYLAAVRNPPAQGAQP